MMNVNLNVVNKDCIDTTDELVKNINLEDLGLILKQAMNEIENGIGCKNAYEALDEVEMEVFGGLLRNKS